MPSRYPRVSPPVTFIFHYFPSIFYSGRCNCLVCLLKFPSIIHSSSLFFFLFTFPSLFLTPRSHVSPSLTLANFRIFISYFSPSPSLFRFVVGSLRLLSAIPFPRFLITLLFQLPSLPCIPSGSL